MSGVAGSIHLPINGRGRTDLDPDHRNRSASTDDPYVRQLLNKTFEKGSGDADRFECIGQLSAPIYKRRPRCQNGLVATVHEAFANEVPLALSPDHIWAAITQAVAIHVNENAEQLRDVFVAHEGKKEIVVRHDGLTFGDPKSPWHEVFPVFADRLRESIKEPELVDVALGKYSTTGSIESIVHTLALMDTLQTYFEYTVMTLCGIPRIDLLGTADDWRRVRANAERLLQMVRMDNWDGELLPVLDQFVALASGTVEERATTFWERIYAVGGADGSGVIPYCTGWLLVFFPFAVQNGKFVRRATTRYTSDNLIDAAFWADKERQGLAGYEKGRDYDGMEYETIPSGTSRVPFLWKDYGSTMQEYDMAMCGGFLAAIGAGPKGTVIPVFTWAVAHGKPTRSDAGVPDWEMPLHNVVRLTNGTPGVAADVNNCTHGLVMGVSVHSKYRNGWLCDQCSAKKSNSVARWRCDRCTIDVCTTCRPSQPMGSSAAAGAAGAAGAAVFDLMPVEDATPVTLPWK